MPQEVRRELEGAAGFKKPDQQWHHMDRAAEEHGVQVHLRRLLGLHSRLGDVELAALAAEAGGSGGYCGARGGSGHRDVAHCSASDVPAYYRFVLSDVLAYYRFV